VGGLIATSAAWCWAWQPDCSVPGGQLILFRTVPAVAPAYLVFPFIALNPIVTVLLATLIARERVLAIGWAGIVLAVVAGAMLNYQSPSATESASAAWVGYTLMILAAWGLQGFVISYANKSMKAESIFFYMMLAGLLLAPFAWQMTDRSRPINWGWSGPGLSAVVQSLNSIGALLLVYSYRYGKAMIVAPLTNAGAPVITAILSLILQGVLPEPIPALGIVLAIVATLMMVVEEETCPPPTDVSESRPG
jgi:drug/metabolite transporter (DMT)-like permease